VRAGRGQAGELVAAGHQHQAVGGAWQQWADLFRVACVVQDHQDTALRQQGPVEAGLRRRAGRDPVRRDLQCFEEAPHRLDRGDRRAGRVETTQVHVQLAVGELAADPVCPVDGHCGLADACCAGQHDDPGRRRVLGEQTVQAAELLGTSRETGDVGRQLCGYGHI
jgi:hypothetical protein